MPATSTPSTPPPPPPPPPPSPLPFLAASALFLAAYGASAASPGVPAYLTVSVAFGLITLLELAEALLKATHAPKRAAADGYGKPAWSPWWYALPVRLWAVALPLAHALGLWAFKRALAEGSGARAFALCLSNGVLHGTFGFTMAHELCHSRYALDRLFAWTLSAQVFYGHWPTEHRYHHHRFVATPLDPATARYGQSVYAYFAQTIVGTFKTAYRRNGVRGQRRVLGCAACSALVTLASAAYVGGVLGAAYHLFVSAVSVLLLETVQYLEHYGLQRKRVTKGEATNADDFERVANNHSWNAESAWTDPVTVHLQHHAHHHRDPTEPYYTLVANPEHNSPQLVLPYSSMAIISLLPPVFFSAMDRRLEGVKRGEIETTVRVLNGDGPAVLTTAGVATAVLSLLFVGV